MADIHQDRTLTCVYCGLAYPPGTPTHGAPILTAHVVRCPKHPMKGAIDLLREMIDDGYLDNDEDLYDRVSAYLKSVGA